MGATLHCGAHASHCSGFSLQALAAQASVVAMHGLSGSMAVESSQARNQIYVPCTGRQNLIHCATRDVLKTNNFWTSLAV